MCVCCSCLIVHSSTNRCCNGVLWTRFSLSFSISLLLFFCFWSRASSLHNADALPGTSGTFPMCDIEGTVCVTSPKHHDVLTRVSSPVSLTTQRNNAAQHLSPFIKRPSVKTEINNDGLPFMPAQRTQANLVRRRRRRQERSRTVVSR
ncbi:hypothetical protein BKA81DRAFT_371292 [Phyllosticta paracitricarpa]